MPRWRAGEAAPAASRPAYKWPLPLQPAARLSTLKCAPGTASRPRHSNPHPPPSPAPGAPRPPHLQVLRLLLQEPLLAGQPVLLPLALLALQLSPLQRHFRIKPRLPLRAGQGGAAGGAGAMSSLRACGSCSPVHLRCFQCWQAPIPFAARPRSAGIPAATHRAAPHLGKRLGRDGVAVRPHLRQPRLLRVPPPPFLRLWVSRGHRQRGRLVLGAPRAKGRQALLSTERLLARNSTGPASAGLPWLSQLAARGPAAPGPTPAPW